MKNKDIINSISAMIKETEIRQTTSEDVINSNNFDISYEDGIKYFGSMMERILCSIDKIESNFEKMKDLN